MNVKAAKVTAPAEISLINPILGWFSLCTKSANFSTAVFMPYIPKTKPIASVWLIQSCLEIPTRNPTKIVKEKMMVWAIILCSVFNNKYEPLNAYLKLLSLPFINKIILFCVFLCYYWVMISKIIDFNCMEKMYPSIKLHIWFFIFYFF